MKNYKKTIQDAPDCTVGFFQTQDKHSSWKHSQDLVSIQLASTQTSQKLGLECPPPSFLKTFGEPWQTISPITDKVSDRVSMATYLSPVNYLHLKSKEKKS